jgi:hypothetical protein
MSMDRWWNNTDRGKQRYCEKKKTVSLTVSFHFKSRIYWPRMEPVLHTDGIANSRLNHGIAPHLLWHLDRLEVRLS